MTSSSGRAATLVRALRAGVEYDPDTIAELCTDDVRAWTPALSTATLAELLAHLERLDDAFSDVQLEVMPLEVVGDLACAEWTVSMAHTGPLAIADGTVVEPTGLTITVHGITVAEFRGDRICSVRQYWDELSVFEQLGLVGR